MLAAENGLGIGVEEEVGGVEVAALVGAEVAVELVAVEHMVEVEGGGGIGGGREEDVPDVAGLVPVGVEGDDLGGAVLQCNWAGSRLAKLVRD